MPLSRYAAPTLPASPPLSAKNTPSEPNSIVSTIGHSATSNARCGLRIVTK
jgi:hypothetical protein